MRDDDDDDRPRKKKRTTAGGPPTALLVGGGIAAALIVLGTVVAVVLVLSKPKPGAAQATGTGTGTTATPGVPAAVPSGWVSFRHPEGLFTVNVPVNPVPFGQPDGGSVYAPPKFGTFNSSTFVAVTRDLNASMEVRVFSGRGLEDEREADARLMALAGGRGAQRTDVKWAGRDAVEDRDILPPQRSVRRRLYDGDRMYQFTFFGAPGRPTDAELTAFFDSFVPGAVK